MLILYYINMHIIITDGICRKINNNFYEHNLQKIIREELMVLKCMSP